MFIFFATWSEFLSDLRKNFLDKIVKTAFYVSKQTFYRKKFIHQFQKLREIFRDFGQETTLTLSSFQNCTQRVEREFDRILSDFQFLSRVSKLDTSSAEKLILENTFHEENFLALLFSEVDRTAFKCPEERFI